MSIHRTHRSTRPRHVRLVLILAIAASCAFAAYPSRASATGECFAACSKLYQKHLAAVTACVGKNLTKGSLSCDYTKLATKMHAAWSTKPQSKCNTTFCANTYPTARVS